MELNHVESVFKIQGKWISAEFERASCVDLGIRRWLGQVLGLLLGASQGKAGLKGFEECKTCRMGFGMIPADSDSGGLANFNVSLQIFALASFALASFALAFHVGRCCFIL